MSRHDGSAALLTKERETARRMSANPRMTERIARFAKTFWSDTSGIILPYVTLMLVVIVGLAVLALDGARFMSLQTQLQNGADALALAGAAELDRLRDSRTRAVRAINSLLANRTSFDGGRNVQVSRVEFYGQLPVSDARPISEATLATDGTNARFISVAVRPISLDTILPAAFFGGANSIPVGAAAVAGFDQVICQ